MVVEDDSNGSPKLSENPSRKRREIAENGHKNENLLSPRFRSVAAMAGWDEEALLIASLIVEDTPDRQCKQRRRTDLHAVKSPPTNSRRKRFVQRRSSATSIPVAILNLDEDEPKPKPKRESKRASKEEKSSVDVKKKQRVDLDDEEKDSKKSCDVSSSTPSIPCLDRLREELSCAVCLEICYEPSTTPCGHSFCKKCLSSAADKCGRKCPKCRQIISNGKYCKVNTVLWNTIQLLFPGEVEARKAAAAAEADSVSEKSREAQSRTTRSRTNQNHHQITRSRAVHDLPSLEGDLERRRICEIRNRLWPASRGLTRQELSSQQDRDAEIALRLQREEFRDAFLGADVDDHRSSLSTATANLRAMASRAINTRISRGRRD